MTGSMTGRLLSNRYRITERIGLGGMAEVYRAQDSVLGRSVAVKVMLPQYANDPTFTARFRQEAAAAANLQSPYIVNVYDWGQDGDTNFMVMEFVRGTDLKNAINQRGAINQRKVAEIGSQVCQALSVAHGMDIIHRDIKPQNIMIQPDGNVKVMDFGIARAKNSTLAKTSAVLGTAHYISPEQAQGKDLTPASDIYSLGVVLYESATGKLPFDGPDSVSVAMKQVQENPQPPRTLNPEISPDLEAIILKAMAKKPEERFATALDMRRALNDYLAGKPLSSAAMANTKTEVIGSIPSGYAQQRGATAGHTAVMPPLAGASSAHQSSQPRRYDSYQTVPQKSKTPAVVAGVIVALLVIAAAVFAFMHLAPQSGNVDVPNVTKTLLPDAMKQIEDAGLVVGTIQYRVEEGADEGTVLDQNPKAGAKVARKSKVSLVVAQGKNQIVVPNLENMTLNDAKKALHDLGLQVAVGDSVFNETIPKGKVADQDPKAGSPVEKGATVTLMPSAGIKRSSVPNVVGMTEAEARVTLENAGFSVEVEKINSSKGKLGSVVKQTPAAGAQAREQASVLVTVIAGVNKHKVSLNVSSGGRVWASSSQVSEGDSVTIYYEAKSGYVLDKAVDTRSGKSFRVSDETEGSFLVSNVTQDVSVSVSFKKVAGSRPSTSTSTGQSRTTRNA